MVSRSDVVTGIKVISKFKCLMDTYVIFLYAVIVTATPRIYNQLCSFDNFLQLTANVWTLLRLTDMWVKKIVLNIFYLSVDIQRPFLDIYGSIKKGWNRNISHETRHVPSPNKLHQQWKKKLPENCFAETVFFLRLCFQRLFWMFSDWTLTHWEISEILFTAH